MLIARLKMSSQDSLRAKWPELYRSNHDLWHVCREQHRVEDALRGRALRIPVRVRLCPGKDCARDTILIIPSRESQDGASDSKRSWPARGTKAGGRTKRLKHPKIEDASGRG